MRARRWRTPASMFSRGLKASRTPSIAAVSGMSCMSPRAPCLDTARGSNPDSARMTAQTRRPGTACRAAIGCTVPTMGEPRVGILHRHEVLRAAYPGGTAETILTEIVANSLASGATTITISTDPAAPALTIGDDGMGMRRRELRRYHDIAASTKVRGERIGFAGVGIKIGLLVSRQVLTETRLGKHHVATAWGLSSRHRAPWRWVAPPGLVVERGTAVRLTLGNALSPLLDPGFIEGVVRRHFQPLLEPALAEMLSGRYPRAVCFVVNGTRLEKQGWSGQDVAPIAVRLARKRKPAAAGYMVRDHLSIPEEPRGLAVSTFGNG